MTDIKSRGRIIVVRTYVDCNSQHIDLICLKFEYEVTDKGHQTNQV